MKKVVLFLVVLSMSIAVQAQTSVSKMELKPNGFMSVDSVNTKNYLVLNFESFNKEDLYKKALVHLNSFYLKPDNVLTSVENESIVVNAFTNRIDDDSGLYKYYLEYNFNIQFKDGKIRFKPLIVEITKVFESINKKYTIYVANTDSPKEVEINCIWMKNKNDEDYFLYADELKNSIDKWLNNYVSDLIQGVNGDDW